MPGLDVFKGDGFSVAELSDALDLLPYKPSRLGAMGIFSVKKTRFLSVMVEERNNELSLITSTARGTRGQTLTSKTRKVRSFAVPHLQINDEILADDSQGVRAFGSESETEVVNDMVNDKLEQAKQNLEVTREWHRMGALHGVLLDGDGSTVLHNYFTEFGIVEQVENFDFTANSGIGQSVVNAKRKVEDALGATPFSGVHCIAGDQWFDAFVEHEEVKAAYDRYQDGSFLRADNRAGFRFKDVIFENYRGQVGNVPFIASDQARFFPVGVPNFFQVWYAPADYAETVNTMGREWYAKTEMMKFDKGVEIEVQSNPLHLPRRPKALVKGTGTFSS